MKLKQLWTNVSIVILAVALIIAIILGIARGNTSVCMKVDDGIEQIDLDTIYLKNSGIEVDFSDVILSKKNETRKLIVNTQQGTVTVELTDRLIKQLDMDFLKKVQKVTYTGDGYFVVDLDKLTADNIIVDEEKHTVTIKIGHAYLQSIEIDSDNIIIDEVEEGLLARGDIKLTVADYNAIENDIRSRLEKKFDTAANGQAADDIAIKMVKDVYEPIIKAIDYRYSVIVQFE